MSLPTWSSVNSPTMAQPVEGYRVTGVVARASVAEAAPEREALSALVATIGFARQWTMPQMDLVYNTASGHVAADFKRTPSMMISMILDVAKSVGVELSD